MTVIRAALVMNLGGRRAVLADAELPAIAIERVGAGIVQGLVIPLQGGPAAYLPSMSYEIALVSADSDDLPAAA